MPYGRRYRRRKTNRKRKPVRVAKKVSKTIARYRNPFKTLLYEKMFIKDRYTQAISYTTVGGFDSQVYRVNSLFDPDYTGVGTSSIGIGYYGTMYSRYRVYSCLLRVKVANNSDNIIRVIIDASVNSTAPATAAAAMAQKGAVTYMIGPNTGSKCVKTIYYPISMKKIYGTKDISDNDSLSAQVTANPSSPLYACITLSDLAGNNLNVDLFNDLLFNVSYYHPVELTY